MKEQVELIKLYKQLMEDLRKALIQMYSDYDSAQDAIEHLDYVANALDDLALDLDYVLSCDNKEEIK